MNASLRRFLTDTFKQARSARHDARAVPGDLDGVRRVLARSRHDDFTFPYPARSTTFEPLSVQTLNQPVLDALVRLMRQLDRLVAYRSDAGCYILPVTSRDEVADRRDERCGVGDLDTVRSLRVMNQL